MYKKFFMGIAAMAALTLVSCSSDDLDSLSDNSSKNEAISFDGYLGRSAVAVNGSRGSVLENTQLQNSDKGFGVFGNYTYQTSSTNLFYNQQVTCKNSEWTYTPLRYWPTQGHIDFLAYAPYDAGTKLTNTSIAFTVENKAADQKDLLWANATNKTKENGTVKFQFAHALSRLGYSVKLNAAYSEATITLNKITLAGSADEATKAFYTAGTIDLSKTSSTDLWTTSSTDAKQNFKWFSGTHDLGTTDYSNPATDYLFVIPQDFSITEPNADELYVIVEYTIEYNSGVKATVTNTVSSQITEVSQVNKYQLACL